MGISSIEEIVAYLKKNSMFFYERFGVTRMGISGSFTGEEQTSSNDIDMVVEIEKNRKNIHSFLEVKRFLGKELARKIDLAWDLSIL